ncbi:MAG: hypothetical protein QG599_2988 [Pseudomonadota bacterium]|nr:hypothetical protein [Pseudomonadota bacterium]
MSARFRIIPARAVCDTRLSRGALLVLNALGIYGDLNGWCWPSQGTIAKCIKLHRTSVTKYITELEQLGYIEKKRQAQEGKGEINSLYRILFDGELPAEFDAILQQADGKTFTPPVNPGFTRTSHRTTHTTTQGNAPSERARAPDPPPPPVRVRAPKGRPPAQEPLPACPDWLPAETWQAFIDHRKELKKPPTASSATMTLKQLDKARGFGHDPATLIETAIASNWTGCVFPERHHQPAPIHVPATPTPHNGQRYTPPMQAMTPEVAEFDAILRNLNIQSDHTVIEGECRHVAH